MIKRIFCRAILSITLLSSFAEELRFSDVFQDNMVLQRELPMRIWGTGKAEAMIQIRCGDIHEVTQISNEGEWFFELPGQNHSGYFDLTIKSESDVVSIHNVRLGEVWLCAGQSNMQWMMHREKHWNLEKESVKEHDVVLFNVPIVVAPHEMSETMGKWKQATAESVEWFSAVGYYFGKTLSSDLNVPVGVINASQGGTNAIAWIGEKASKDNPDLSHYWLKYNEAIANQGHLRRQWESEMARYLKNESKKPLPPMGLGNFNTPSGLYNGMISPFNRLSLRGVIWYQGESNVDRADEYKSLLSSLIQDWRSQFGRQDLPFYIVQLPGFDREEASPERQSWSELRQSQFEVVREVDDAILVVLIDQGQRNEIHPSDKKSVGVRIAKQALLRESEEKDIYSGPLFQSAKVIGDEIWVQFENGEGLNAGIGNRVHGFEISADNVIFVPTDSYIEENVVKIQIQNGINPVAIRYGWGNWPEFDLLLGNCTGLLASPFESKL